jgi:hypothetical protein
MLDEAISVAKELNDTHALAMALGWAARQAFTERNPAEVDRFDRYDASNANLAGTKG